MNLCGLAEREFLRIRKYKNQSYMMQRWLKTVSQNTSQLGEVDISKIRNVGILAHVDAGKTTTTEKMLHASGMLSKAGKVDKGDTTTDYLPQERERGITIMTACVTLPWAAHKINLLDTPGHVDFSIEVERCLRVMDGAILLLDASAGVEAQTLALWRQLQRFRIPTVCYANKMDKPGADFSACLASVRHGLGVAPLPLHYPNLRAPAKPGLKPEPAFAGTYDLVSGPTAWECATDSERQTLSARRNELIETLADTDPGVMDVLMRSEDYGTVPGTILKNALRLGTRNGSFLPVLCGSSACADDKYVGTLLDAVCDYLPDPTFLPGDTSQPTADDRGGQGFASPTLDGQGVYAVVFKILNDKQNGLVSFIRVYGGTLKAGQYLSKLEPTCSQAKAGGDKVGDVWVIQGENLLKVQSVKAGNIAVVSGLSTAYTGDRYVSPSTRASLDCPDLQHLDPPVRRYLKRLHEAHSTYKSLRVPDAIFYCTVEAGRAGTQKDLDRALTIMAREDPSLRVEKSPTANSVHSAFGQAGTIISGQGQLHVQVVKDRLRTEFNGLEAYLGPLRVRYREKPKEVAEASHQTTKTLNERKYSLAITLSIHPIPGDTDVIGPLQLIHTRENNLAQIPKHTLQAIEAGVRSALSNGGTHTCSPVVGCRLNLHAFTCDASSYGAQEALLATVSALAGTCALGALAAAGCTLLEPVMRLRITEIPNDRLSHVTSDLIGRCRARIQEISPRVGPIVATGGNGHVTAPTYQEITASVPLIHMADYASKLRTLTSGIATFTMELETYQPVDGERSADSHWDFRR